MTGNNSPLAGLTVVDFSRVLAGPMCSMVLADLGADVIKIERPSVGDDTRAWGPPFIEGDAAYFLSTNRGKRSVALDLRDADDLEVARAIVSRADILVENFRQGVMDGFGLGYDDVKDLNPGLVYCSVTAFSSESEFGDAGYDLLMQALSGFMSVTGEPERAPVKMGSAILDVVAGLFLTVGALAALRDREMSGQGRQISVGLFEASVAALVNQASNYLLGGVVPVAEGTAHPNIVPYQVFETADGEFALAAGNDKLFQLTCSAIGRRDLGADERLRTNAGRVSQRDELIPALEKIFVEETTDHWVALLVDAGVPAAPVRSIDEVFDSPEGAASVATIDDPVRGLLRVVRNPLVGIGVDSSDYRSPPRLGEHNDEVFQWLERQSDGRRDEGAADV